MTTQYHFHFKGLKGRGEFERANLYIRVTGMAQEPPRSPGRDLLKITVEGGEKSSPPNQRIL